LTLKEQFVLNFVDGGRWKWLVDGLKNTLIITFFALLIGVAIGTIIGIVKVLPRSGEVQLAEAQKKTVVEALPECAMAMEYRDLAKRVMEAC